MFLGGTALAQRDFSVVTNLHYGFVIPHHPEVVNLIQGHTKALEVNLAWKTDGSKSWHHDYHFPVVGLDFFVSNLGNNLQLGNQYSTIGYVDFPLNAKQNHFFKTGVGVGYASKIWNLQDNPKDLFLGSHFNAAILLQYTFKLRLNDRVDFRTGARITHFSNGSISLPNKGINNATIFLGFSIKQTRETRLETDVSNPPLIKNKKVSFSTLITSGLKQISVDDPKKYQTFSMTNLLDKRVSSKTSWGIGMDVFYNSGLRTLITESTTELVGVGKTIQLGGVFSFTKHLDPWEIKIMLGAYVIDHYKKNGFIYNRFGLRYHLNEHLLLGLSLKTHYARADFAELGVGWEF